MTDSHQKSQSYWHWNGLLVILILKTVVKCHYRHLISIWFSFLWILADIRYFQAITQIVIIIYLSLIHCCLFFPTEILGRIPQEPGAQPESDPVGTCWGRQRGASRRDLCTNPISQGLTFMDCCCSTGSVPAVAWGGDCDPCPPRGSCKFV